jgi:hypothetical protein
MNKIKLPISEKIILESNPDQWRLLFRKLITKFDFYGIIEINDGRKVKISIVLQEVLPPEYSTSETKCNTRTNMGHDISTGISRITEFLNDYLAKDCWLLSGYIDGEHRIPIVIMYYEKLDLAIYSQKLTTEDVSKFMPAHFNINLN